MSSVPKTLVIGSTGHAHVTCVDWQDVHTVNVVDFAQVVVNCRSLTVEYLSSVNFDFFQKLRVNFVRLLDSGGRIIAVGTETRTGKVTHVTPEHTYSWSPIAFATVEESGDTIEPLQGDFPRYLGKLKDWKYWYGLSSRGALTHELCKYYNDPTASGFKLDTRSIVVNRYGRPLAVAYTLLRPNQGRMLGSIVLLPHLSGVESREAMNLVLEDLLDLPQTVLPPEWAAELVVPGVAEIESEVASTADAIEALNQKIVALELRKADLTWCRKLLYESGTELERVFSGCLENMGGKIIPAKYSQEEFVLEFEGQRALVECKGVSKSASLTHVRQITDYTLKYEEDEGQAGRGVLFVNAWRNLHPKERETTETPTFPPNVLTAAAQRGIALVSSLEFFRAYCEFLAERVEGTEVLRRLCSSNGVVKFP